MIAASYPEEISFDVRDAFGNTLISGGLAYENCNIDVVDDDDDALYFALIY